MDILESDFSLVQEFIVKEPAKEKIQTAWRKK